MAVRFIVPHFLGLALAAGAVTGQITAPEELEAARMGGSPTGGDTAAAFALGLTLDNGASYVDVAQTSESVRITGVIRPEPGHVGLKGDIFLVDRVNGTFTMRDPDGNFEPWNTRVPDLVPYLEDVTLEETLEVPVFRGRLGAEGDHRVFLGYLPEGGVLHYTPFPLRLDIIEGEMNGSCVKPEPEQRGKPGAALNYREAATNTSTKVPGDQMHGHHAFVRDFDGDGRDDLFWLETSFDRDAFEQATAPRVWLSSGSGGFTEATTSWLPGGLEAADGPRQFFDADIDGDGDRDFVVLQHGFDPIGWNGLDCGNSDCPGAPNMIILWDQGELRDVAAEALNPYDLNGFTHGGGVADVDCDGDMDILEGQIVLELANAPSRLQLNDGAGGFLAQPQALPWVIESWGSYGMVLCDLDSDGDPDIYAAQHGIMPEYGVADVVFANDGFGSFHALGGTRAPVSRVGEDRQRPADMQCFDYDGDGFNDILKPNEADHLFPAFELLHNEGDMTFSDATDAKLPQTPLRGGSYRPIIHDLNADGWPDIVAEGTADYLRIYWNTGNGFEEYIFPARTAISTSGTSETVGDFDGDGDSDIHVNRADYGDYVLWAE